MKHAETEIATRRNIGSHPMSCSRADALMSPFIDSMTGPGETKLFEEHIEDCQRCQRQLQGYVSLRNVLRSAEEPTTPSDLGFRIRLKLSRQRSAGRFAAGERFRLWASHTARAFAFPAVVGISMTLVCFSVVLESMAGYSEVQIKEPTLALIGRSIPTEVEAMMVEVFVSPEGRSSQYAVLSGPEGNPEVDRWLHAMMSHAEFKPATLAGRPVSGRVIMSIPGTSIGVPADGLPGASIRGPSSAI